MDQVGSEMGGKEKILTEMLGRVEELATVSKLMEEIERFETLEYESKERDTKKWEQGYLEAYRAFQAEPEGPPERPEERRLWKLKKEYLRFYDQLSSEIENLDFELTKEHSSEVLQIVRTLGRRQNCSKIIDVSEPSAEESCSEHLTPLVVNRHNARLKRGLRDFRFFFKGTDEVWPALIGYLNEGHYGVRRADRDRGVVVTETTYFDERGHEWVQPSREPPPEEGDNAGRDNYLDSIAFKPALKGGVWFGTKEIMRIRVVAVVENLTKVKVRLFAEGCNSLHGWHSLRSKKTVERSILDGVEKRLGG